MQDAPEATEVEEAEAIDEMEETEVATELPEVEVTPEPEPEPETEPEPLVESTEVPEVVAEEPDGGLLGMPDWAWGALIFGVFVVVIVIRKMTRRSGSGTAPGGGKSGRKQTNR